MELDRVKCVTCNILGAPTMLAMPEERLAAQHPA